MRGTKPRVVADFQGWCVWCLGVRGGAAPEASGDGAVGSVDAVARAAAAAALSLSRQQCLYLRPDPQWQGSLRPGRAAPVAGTLATLGPLGTTGAFTVDRCSVFAIRDTTWIRS